MRILSNVFRRKNRCHCHGTSSLKRFEQSVFLSFPRSPLQLSLSTSTIACNVLPLIFPPRIEHRKDSHQPTPQPVHLCLLFPPFWKISQVTVLLQDDFTCPQWLLNSEFREMEMCGPFWLSAVLGSRIVSIGVSKTEPWLSPSDPRVSHSASQSLALTPNPNLQKRARGWGCGSVVQHAQSPGFNPQQPPPLPVQLVIIHLIRLLRRRHEGRGGAMLHTGTALLRNYSCAYNIRSMKYLFF